MSTSSHFLFERFQPDRLVCFDSSECPAVLAYNRANNSFGRSRGEGSPNELWLYTGGWLIPANYPNSSVVANQTVAATVESPTVSQPWYFIPKQSLTDGLKTFRIANSQGLLVSFAPVSGSVTLVAENVTTVKTSLRREPLRNEWIWQTDLSRLLAETAGQTVNFPLSNPQLKLIHKCRHIWAILHSTPASFLQVPDLRKSGDNDTNGFPLSINSSAYNKVCKGLTVNLNVCEDQSWAMISNSLRNITPTGLYALPGDTVNINLTGDSGDCKVHLLLFAFNDVIPDKKTWLRPPQICIREVLKLGDNLIKSPYGGPVVIYVEGCKEAVVRLQFENVVEMLSYDHHTTTKQDWDRLRSSNCPWATVKGDKIVLLELASNVTQLSFEQVEGVASRFDDIFRWHMKASGFERGAERPHIVPEGHWWFVRDIQLKDSCRMRAGTITMLQMPNSTDYYINEERFLNSNSTRWGVLHEMGHNMQLWPYCMEFGVNNMSGHEITANLWTVHTDIKMNEGNLRQPSRIEAFRKAVQEKLPAKVPYKEMEWAEALTFFLQIYKLFGWEAFRDTNRRYRELGYDDIVYLTENPSKRVDFFYQMSSQVVGYDLSPHFDAYQIPLSIEAKEKMRNLPKVSDDIFKQLITERF